MPDALVARLRAAGCVYAEDEARLLTEATDDPVVREALVVRRVAGEPLEHLLGWADFCGVRVVVGPGVFVPRPRSALLVERAVRAAAPARRPVLVDLCCGSGAIALVLATRLAERAPEVHAADLEPAAVACARLNLHPVGGRVHEGDLDAALPADLRGRVDVLVANVPYVPSADVASMPAEARDHEPRSALDGGADGLDLVRRVAAAAPAWLAPGGTVLVETSAAQADRAAAVFAAAGLEPTITADEDAYVVEASPAPHAARVWQGRGMDTTDFKETLAGYLQDAREAMLWKLDGLSEYDVRRPLTPTGTNLLGLVKHLASVESGYFGATFGRPYPETLPWHTEEADHNDDMFATAEESREDIVAFYRRVWAHSDATIEAADLDTVGRVDWWPPERAEVTLHTILVRLVAETNRHAGHADIVRELIDQQVGYQALKSNLPEDDYDWAAHHARVERAAQDRRTVEP